MWLTGVTVEFDNLQLASPKLVVDIPGTKIFEKSFRGQLSTLCIRFGPCEVERGIPMSISVWGPKAHRLGRRRNALQISIAAEEALRHFDVTTSTSKLRNDSGACSLTLGTIAGQGSMSKMIKLGNAAAKEMTTMIDVLRKTKGSVQTGIEVAKIAAEFHPASKAIVGFMDVVYKHIQAQAECDDNVKKLSEDLLALFYTVEKAKKIDKFDDFLRAIHDTDDVLRTSFRFIIQYTRQTGKKRFFRGGAVDRGNLEDIKTQIGNIKQNLDRTVLLHIAETVQSIATAQTPKDCPPSFFFKDQLPPKPLRFLGRELELETAVSVLTEPKPAAIAIRGDGGMGKTTLARAVLHDGRVKRHYGSRLFFVECEDVKGRAALLAALADVLRIPSGQRKEDLLDEIGRILGEHRNLLCLDNFEDPWHASRQDIERVLSHLAHIGCVSLIVTLRGVQYPAASEVNWSKVPHPLAPLPPDPARALFQQTADLDQDDFGAKLVTVADGIPLALTLLGQLAQIESTSTLWNRWQHDGTAFIESDGGNHRSASLDTSISLSVKSPLMSNGARDVLALLALLPDGLPESGVLVDLLQDELRRDIKLRNGLRTLLRVALVQPTGAVYTPGRRYQLLSPIRQWIRQRHPLQPGPRDALYNTYFKIMMTLCSDRTNAEHRIIVCPELRNYGSLLTEAFRCNMEHVDLVAVSLMYSHWILYAGNLDGSVVKEALQCTTKPSLRADCRNMLGIFQVRWHELDEAEKSFRSALVLHEQAQSVLGQATDLKDLGELQMRRDELEEAEKSFRSALALHERAQDVLGQADDLQDLGQLQMRRDELEEAEKSLRSALALHEQAQSVLGQGNDLQKLGQLQMRRGELEEAEKSFRSALALHERAQDVLGQANDLQDLGKLQVRHDELENTEKSFRSALALHERAQDVLGQANDLRNLGQLQMRHDELEEAEKSFCSALALHEQSQSVLGQANDLQDLGELHMRRNEREEAEKSFRSALVLHEQAQSVLGQGNDLRNLGQLQMRRDELEEAEKSFRSALALHEQAQDVLGQANDLRNLGKLQMRRDELEEAEKSLRSALALHEQARDVLGCANDLHKIGELQMRRDELDEAEKSLRSALALHERAQDVLGQANDLHNLGELQMHRDELGEAEKSLRSALALHETAQSALWRADDLQSLGQIHLRRSNAGDAARFFSAALEVSEDADDLWRQGDASQGLAEVHLCQGDMASASDLLHKAQDLHTSAGATAEKGKDMRLMAQVHMRQHNLGEAEALVMQAISLHEDARDNADRGDDLRALAQLHICRDEFDAAEACFAKAVELHGRAQDVHRRREDMHGLEELKARRRLESSG